MMKQHVQPHKAFKTTYILTVAYLLGICMCLSTRTIDLETHHTASFVLNLSRVSTVNSTIQIEVASEKRLLLNQSLQKLANSAENGLKRIDIMNWEKNTQTIIIRIINDDSAQNQTTQLQKLILQTQILKQDNQYSIFIRKQNVYDFMLPFNLLSEKQKKVFLQQNSYNLSALHYDYQPFLETFWNEHGIDELLITWIPYFSRCSDKFYRRMYLRDIISPWVYPNFELEQRSKICQSTESWFWGSTLECTDKKIQTKCILEQLYVKNTKKQPWWMNTNNVLFYFIKPEAADFEFSEAENSKQILDSIAEEYYNLLTYLEYKPRFDLNSQTPNTFVLNFQIASISNVEQFQIVKAELIASRVIDPKIEEGQANLSINVQYLTNFQTLISYGKPQVVYIIIFMLFQCIILVCFKFCFPISKLNLHFLNICKLIMFPIYKGHTMSFCISISFIAIFFFLASITKFKAIASTFDGDSIDQSWNSIAGRVGFSTLMAGYFLLGIAINQSFKVLTPDQTKIILQDDMIEKYGSDYKKNYAAGQLSEDTQNEDDKQNFIIKNMNSHRKYLMLGILGFSFFLSFIYFIRVYFTLPIKIVFLLVICPVIHKTIIIIYRHLIIKQLIYLASILVTFQSFLDLTVSGNPVVWETLLVCICKFVLENVLYYAIQIAAEWICFKMYKYLKDHQSNQQQPTNLYRILNYFRLQIHSVVSECKYQKSIFYSTLFSIRLAALFVRPFLFCLVTFTIKYNFICKDLQQSQPQITITCGLIFLFTTLDILAIILGIKFFEYKFGLQIIKCLQFNKFKFNRRKVKWMNDIFVQNRCIQHFYRQFQKFSFSSQLYIHIFTIVFATYSLIIGLKIVMEVQYVSFIDPVMLIILCIVWATGNLLSVVVSFVIIKLKFYERKQDSKTRAKLDNIQKILKKSDYSQYLQTQAVKNYFLFHCKQWIVQNMTKIFKKQDFNDNGYQLLMKYKHYKSLLKKKQIQQRKKMQKRIQQKLNQTHNQNLKDKKIVIKLPRKQFSQLAKPLICSWLYMAKQFAFLKALVKHLKQLRKKQTCQFCSMNIELEVVQKNQFSAIVNDYRQMNVGRMFIENHFIEFYKIKQQFITVCIECKDKKFYFEKKHLQMGSNTPQRILICKWLIKARGRLLHKNIQKNALVDFKKRKFLEQ